MALCTAFAICASISSLAFASCPDEIWYDPSHEWEFYDSYEVITSIDETGHSIRTYYIYICTVPGCTLAGCDRLETIEWADHELDTSNYTGYNYHLGNKHYTEYEFYCSVCDYVETRLISYSCPGNGHCILLTRIFVTD